MNKLQLRAIVKHRGRGFEFFKNVPKDESLVENRPPVPCWYERSNLYVNVENLKLSHKKYVEWFKTKNEPPQYSKTNPQA